MKTIGERFSEIVARFPDRLAVKTDKQRLTYSQLDAASDAVALALRQLGVKQGDRVATTLGMSVAHLLVGVLL